MVFVRYNRIGVKTMGYQIETTSSVNSIAFQSSSISIKVGGQVHPLVGRFDCTHTIETLQNQGSTDKEFVLIDLAQERSLSIEGCDPQSDQLLLILESVMSDSMISVCDNDTEYSGRVKSFENGENGFRLELMLLNVFCAEP